MAKVSEWLPVEVSAIIKIFCMQATQIAKSIRSRGRFQDVQRIFIGHPLALPMSALIQKASFGSPMGIAWIWISCGYLMDNIQDVRWIENAIWESTFSLLKANEK